MSKKLKIILQLSISIIILVLITQNIDWHKAKVALLSFDVLLLICIFAIYAADRIWMAWKWKLLIACNNYRITLFDSTKAYFISSLVGFALPLGGIGPDIVRFAILKKYGLSSVQVISSVIVERYLGIISTIFMICLSSVLFLLSEDILDKGDVLYVVAASFVLLALTLIILYGENTRRSVFRKMGVEKLLHSSKLVKYHDELKKYFSFKKQLLLNLFLTIVEQFFGILAFYTAVTSMELGIGFMECLIVVPLSMLASKLPISYAGLGVREGANIFLLGLFGVGAEEAVVLSFVLFLIYIASLIPGVYFMLSSNREMEEELKCIITETPK